VLVIGCHPLSNMCVVYRNALDVWLVLIYFICSWYYLGTYRVSRSSSKLRDVRPRHKCKAGSGRCVRCSTLRCMSYECHDTCPCSATCHCVCLCPVQGQLPLCLSLACAPLLRLVLLASSPTVMVHHEHLSCSHISCLPDALPYVLLPCRLSCIRLHFSIIFVFHYYVCLHCALL
jgi:hypothetical protein